MMRIRAFRRQTRGDTDTQGVPQEEINQIPAAEAQRQTQRVVEKAAEKAAYIRFI